MTRRLVGVDPAKIESAVACCLAAIVQPQGWAGALESLSEASGCVSAVAFINGETARSSFVCNDRSTGSMETYLASPWCTRNPRLLSPPKMGVTSDVDFATADGFSPHYRAFREEFLIKHGMGWFAGSVLFANGSRSVLISVERSHRHDPFTPTELAMLDRAFRRLRDATVFAPALDDALRRALLEGFDRQSQSVAVLGEDGEVLLMNKAAERSTPPYLVLAGGRFHPTCRKLAGAWEERVRRLMAPLSVLGEDAPEPLALRAADGGLMIVRSLPMVPEGRNLFARSRAILFFTCVQPRSPPGESLLRDAFDLTAAEAKLTRALVTRFDLRAAAAACGIAYETARAHLKSVFAKTGVASQAELAALIVGL